LFLAKLNAEILAKVMAEAGEYKFFLFKEDEFFIMICPSEY
jgi:hypothetical protein